MVVCSYIKAFKIIEGLVFKLYFLVSVAEAESISYPGIGHILGGTELSRGMCAHIFYGILHRQRMNSAGTSSSRLRKHTLLRTSDNLTTSKNRLIFKGGNFIRIEMIQGIAIKTLNTEFPKDSPKIF